MMQNCQVSYIAFLQLDDGPADNLLEQLGMKRTWESGNHPYLFFNEDGATFTPLGFFAARGKSRILVMRGYFPCIADCYIIHQVTLIARLVCCLQVPYVAGDSGFNLLDCQTQQVLVRNCISANLKQALDQYRLSMSENFDTLTR